MQKGETGAQVREAREVEHDGAEREARFDFVCGRRLRSSWFTGLDARYLGTGRLVLLLLGEEEGRRCALEVVQAVFSLDAADVFWKTIKKSRCMIRKSIIFGGWEIYKRSSRRAKIVEVVRL